MDITRETFPGVYVRVNPLLSPNAPSEAATFVSDPDRGGGVPPTPVIPPTPTQVATPTFSPTGETFIGSVDVTILCATAGATIYYTTDGSIPTTGSSVYSTPITLTATTTLKAFATKTDMINSNLASDVYTLSLDCPVPTILPALDFPTATTSPSIYKRPSWAAINPTTNVICVLDDVDATIYFVDAVTNTLLHITDMGTGLFTDTSSIVFDSVNNQWVIQNWRDIVFIDGTTFTETARLANLLSGPPGATSGGIPRLLAYDPATGHIFAFSYRRTTSIFTIDGATQTVINTTSLPHTYDSICWLPNIGKAFLTRGSVLGDYYDPVAHTFTTSAVTATDPTHYECLYHPPTGFMLVGASGFGNFVYVIDVTSDTQVGNLNAFGVQQIQDLAVNTCTNETWIADQGSELLFEFTNDLTTLIAAFTASNPVGLTFCRRTNLIYYQDAHYYNDYGLHQSVTYPTTDQDDPLYQLEQFGFESFGDITDVTEITLNAISIIPGIDIENNPTLQKLHCPFLISIDPNNIQAGYLFIDGCSSLDTVELPVFVPNPGNTYAITNCALSAASVNQFLARCVANPIFITGSVDLSGPSNSAPTGQGLTDKSTLISRGVSVTTS